MPPKSPDTFIIFACVKVREGKPSCGPCGARHLIEELRRQIGTEVDAGLLKAHQIEVHPTGCLKKCKKGPAIAVLPPRSKENSHKAPKKAWKKAKLRFKRVSAEDVQPIVEKVRKRLASSRVHS